MTLSLELPVPRESPIANRSPRWKLVAFACAICLVAFLKTLPAALAALSASAIITALARIPFMWLKSRFLELAWSLGPMLAIVAIWPNASGPTFAGMVALKALTIGLLAAVILGSAPLANNLAATAAIGVPGSLVQLALLAYRAATNMADEIDRLRTAIRLRAFRSGMNSHSYRTVAAALGSLLLRSGARSESVSLAMTCRGFNGSFRTAREFPASRLDIAFALVIVGLFLAIWSWDRS